MERPRPRLTIVVKLTAPGRLAGKKEAPLVKETGIRRSTVFSVAGSASAPSREVGGRSAREPSPDRYGLSLPLPPEKRDSPSPAGGSVLKQCRPGEHISTVSTYSCLTCGLCMDRNPSPVQARDPRLSTDWKRHSRDSMSSGEQPILGFGDVHGARAIFVIVRDE